MKRQTALKIVNPLLALLIINQAATGIFHLELSNRAFKALHEQAGYVLITLAAIHLALNWNWVKAQFMPRNKPNKI
jgi:hypothetical protein